MEKAVIRPDRNYIMLGETGSGKSELAINLALSVARTGRQVQLFDMDQSKPLFRARDLEEDLRAGGVDVHFGKQFMDSPVVASAVNVSLKKQNCTTILDVGGGENAARVIGSFRANIEATDTEILYVLNPYRPFSGTLEDINTTLSTILTHSRQRHYTLVLNPNVGHTTTAKEVLDGLAALREMLPDDIAPLCLCANGALWEEIHPYADLPIFPLELSLTYAWSENNS